MPKKKKTSVSLFLEFCHFLFEGSDCIILNDLTGKIFYMLLFDYRFTQNMSIFRRDMAETLRCEGVSESSSTEMMS